jgi:hypothetical protein
VYARPAFSRHGRKSFTSAARARLRSWRPSELARPSSLIFTSAGKVWPRRWRMASDGGDQIGRLQRGVHFELRQRQSGGRRRLSTRPPDPRVAFRLLRLHSISRRRSAASQARPQALDVTGGTVRVKPSSSTSLFHLPSRLRNWKCRASHHHFLDPVDDGLTAKRSTSRRSFSVFSSINLAARSSAACTTRRYWQIGTPPSLESSVRAGAPLPSRDSMHPSD